MRSHLQLFVIAALLLFEMQFLAGAVAPVQIVPVATPPAGETVTFRETRYADPMGDQNAPPISIDAGKRHLILKVDYDPFMTAYDGAKQVWQVPDFISAGGSDPGIFVHSGWSVFFVGQNRVGILIYETSTGRRVNPNGFDNIAIAPNFKWAVFPPWFSWFTECYSGTSVVRMNLTGIPMPHNVPVSEFTKREQCLTEKDNFAHRAFAAIAPNGSRYAIARTNTSDNGSGLLELFDAANDRKLADLHTGFNFDARTFAFSASGRYLVLQGESGDMPKSEWFHIQ